MNSTVVSIGEAHLKIRGYPHRLSDPRTMASRCFMFADRLDAWSAIFVRDLPGQRRPISVPQHRELQRIVERLSSDGGAA